MGKKRKETKREGRKCFECSKNSRFEMKFLFGEK